MSYVTSSIESAHPHSNSAAMLAAVPKRRPSKETKYTFVLTLGYRVRVHRATLAVCNILYFVALAGHHQCGSVFTFAFERLNSRFSILSFLAHASWSARFVSAISKS